jgi:Xaa-Pro aminopeptidase
MPDHRSARLAALRQEMHAAQIDALLVSSTPNIRYLTGFSSSNALVLVTESEVHILTDFRYKTQVREQVGELAAIRVVEESLWSGFRDLASSMKAIDTAGFESAHLSHRDFQRLNEGKQWHWRPQFNTVESLRESKDADEVAFIKQAGKIATNALDTTLRELQAGLTELNVAGILEEALRREGSEEFPFSTIVASGPRTALPHARPSSRIIQSGDFLLLDFGAQVNGYCSDVTRTVVVGRASTEQREIFEVVRYANAIAAKSVRAGMTGRDADDLARRYVAQHGYGEEFGHGLGHGIGLEIHEAPKLATMVDAQLLPGTVITIEPGIYRSGWGGVRIEDDVHLAPSGPEVLTDFTRELLEVA